MASNVAVRVIIVSANLRIKKLIVDSLRFAVNTEVFAAPRTIEEANSYFDKYKANVLILDYYDSTVTERYFNSLISVYNIKIIVIRQMPFSYKESMVLKNIKPPLTTTGTSEVPKFLSSIKIAIQEFRLISISAMPSKRNILGVSENEIIIAIAASTGGTEALIEVLRKMKEDSVPILVVQHMPADFTRMFAERIDNVCTITAKEARNGDPLERGVALIAPGDYHMKLIKRGGKLYVETFSGPKLHGVRPAADHLFESVAEICGKNAVGAILTGMGSDGARGLLSMRKKGSYNVGQDENTCVVYGMPKAAYDIGAIDIQLPITQIGDKLSEIVGKIQSDQT